MKKKIAKKPAKKTAVKKVTVKKTVATPTKSTHRKQRGRTAPNRALSVSVKKTVKVDAPAQETAPNKPTKPVKWVKKGPKKLPKVKAKKIVKAPIESKPVPFPSEVKSVISPATRQAVLMDLSKAKPVEMNPQPKPMDQHVSLPSAVLPIEQPVQPFLQDPSVHWRPVMPNNFRGF